MTLALEDIKSRLSSLGPGADPSILPFSVYLHYHMAILQALEDKDLTPERLGRIKKKMTP